MKWDTLESMKKLAIFLFAVLLISCSKDESGIPFKGIWVEKTQRLDTMEFGSLYMSCLECFYLRSQQLNTGYNFKIKTDTILLERFGSSGGLSAYYFKENNTNQFTISNFFQRPTLPAMVQFEKIH